MARPHAILRHLRPSPERFAAAAALYDPSPMLRLQSTQPREQRPARRPALSAETGAALLLVGAVALALLWSNSPWRDTYESVWHANVGLGTLHADLRTWIDEGLMTLFFLVVGLEAKRERDLGELRDGRRLTVPVVAGLVGMAMPALVYLAVTGGGEGWGVAISTDTALALGALTLAGADLRVRTFMLTLLVVDDVAALLVISFVYPSRINTSALAAAVALLALLLAMRAIAGRQFRARGTSHPALTPLSMLTGIALWLALFESGIDPVVSGLLIGLLTNAYEPNPTRIAPDAQISPNDRLQHRLHPLTSLVVVPIFALANAGLQIDSGLLASAATSPITWGIVLAYIVAKPVGIVTAARMASSRAALRLTARELRGTALSAGVGFTVSLLIASRAFGGAQLDQAKLGIIATALLAPAIAVVALRRRERTRVALTTACAA
jgi:Na+/H+ antiporter NhaA